MATNRGAYDPRQFLHYPDKDPFSDESQKRLDDLVKDFIRTGIAFANGATVHDVPVEERVGNIKPNSHLMNGLDEAELESSPEALEGNNTVEDEVHEQFGRFRRIDKGKGRDEREGPGLQGIWDRSNAVPPGITAEDAISLSSGSGFGDDAAGDEEFEDEDGFYEEGFHEDGVLDEAVRVYERDGDGREGSDSGTELEPLNSRAPSSEQEIIYIGDSDEDGPKSPTGSDLEVESFQPLSKPADEEAQVDHLEDASGPGLIIEEKGAFPDVWLSGGGQDEDHSQGKESDEDESRSFEHGQDRSTREVESNSAAKDFTMPAPLINPWASSGADVLSESSIHGLTDAEHQILWREPDIEPKINGQGTSQGEGDAPDSLKSPLQVLPEIQTESGTNAPAATEAFPLTHSTSAPVITTPLSNLNPVAEQHDNVTPPNDTVLSLDRASDNLVPVPTFSPSRQVAPIFSAAERPITPSITYPEVPSSDSTELFHFFDAVPSELPIMETQHFHGATEAHTSISEMETSEISNTDCTSVTQVGPPEQFLSEVSAASSGAPTEPILYGSHYSQFSENAIGQTEQPYSHLDSMRVNQVDGSDTQQIPSSAASAKLAKDFSVVPHQVQNGFGIDQPTSREIFKAIGEPSSSVDPGKVDVDYHIPTTDIHPPVIFDQGGHFADINHASTSSPVAKTASPIASIELHTVNSVELHPEDVAKESSTAAEDRSEYGRDIDRQESGNVEIQEKDTLETCGPSRDIEEVRSRNAEVSIPPVDNSLVSERDAQDRLERLAPSDYVPTISVGSSTPPLSPEATVTNCSSVPDASVATSDLSTVNAATISVVTSTSSPPPIHISRPSPIPADIRQPRGTHVGFAPEEDHQEENDFPDPRLPPEPTHLRIPVGVISRGLTDDKEDRAESIKVEPPTPHVEDESEDDSLHDAGEKPDGEKPTSSTGLEPDTDGARDGFEPYNATDEKLVTCQETTKETFTVDDAPVGSDCEPPSPVIGLTYPDSDSDNLKKEKGGSDSPVDPPLSVFEGGKRSLSRSEHDSSSPTSEAVHLAVRQQDDLPRTSTPPNGSLQSNIDTSVAGPNGDPITPHRDDHKEALPYDLDTFPESMHLNATIPVVNEKISPSKVKHRSRISTKRKAKGKGKARMSSESEHELPSPMSTIHVQVKGTASTHKRSRISEAAFESSKQRRLTRSATARNAIGSIGDGASGSAISDDKSDVSSIASSSSLVSRILRPTSSKPSSFVTVRSRSSSIMSQTSPSSAMAPPIRPYVPHNHSHHSQTSAVHSPKARRRTTTPTLRRSQSASPSPSAPSQPTSTHLTRATCTDHKISIPGPDGILSYFLIPRCSLLEPEAEKDDRIVDCGVATEEEVKRAVGDLDAIGLDSEILGVIRQLAGVDMMREQQVGYLLKPGEGIRRRGKKRRPHILPPSIIQDAAPEVDPPGPSGAGSSHLNPLDQEVTTSPTSSSGPSFSEASKSEDIDGHKNRHPNALKTDPNEPILEDEREDEGENKPDEDTVVTSSPSLRSSHGKPNKPRRRGLRTDDAAYKPENDDAESSSGTESPGAKRKLKGIKRRRSEGSALGEQASADVIESGEIHPKKKRRRRDKPTLQDGSREDGSGSPKKNRRKTDHLKPEI